MSLKPKEFDRVLHRGAEEIVERFGGDPSDLDFIESRGRLPFDSPQVVSKRACERGKNQVGTLGSGNHFIEIQRVEDIYDPEAAAAFGLEKGHITVMIHTGSRGFGHQIATDHIETLRGLRHHKKRLPDPQLIHADIHSKEGNNYLQALNAASNFAWANRQLIMQDVIALFETELQASRDHLGIRLLYDQAHNIAKFEDHTVEGQPHRLLVHRKGATRAFPPGHPDIPARFRNIGQPVIIPGSMGSASYVLKGTTQAMALTFGSSAHGAGRRMSRHQAVKVSASIDVQQQMKAHRILVYSFSQRGLREEIPEAYKNIEEVVDITVGAGISDKIARLRPLVVIKG